MFRVTRPYIQLPSQYENRIDHQLFFNFSINHFIAQIYRSLPKYLFLMLNGQKPALYGDSAKVK